MSLIDLLPHITASLNGVAGILIVIGFFLIKNGHRKAHQRVMTSAVAVSALFLVTYVLHHLLQPLFQFRGEGAVRPIYFALLFSHVGLAVLVTPMIVMTFLRARKALPSGQFDRHKALARWTLPIWLYVSVTGIIVYWLLYHVYV